MPKSRTRSNKKQRVFNSNRVNGLRNLKETQSVNPIVIKTKKGFAKLTPEGNLKYYDKKHRLIDVVLKDQMTPAKQKIVIDFENIFQS